MATNYDLYTARRSELILELNSVIDDIIRRHIELGQKASGDFIDALEIRETELGAQLWGMDYTDYLVNGRRPGKMPPKSAIVQWLQDKFGYDQKTAEAISFPVRKKIKEKGTDIYLQGGTDLISSVLNDKRIELILSKLKIIYTDFVVLSIRQELQTL